MKNNYEIVQELKEEEKQGRLSSSTKESSKNNVTDQNLENTCFKNFFENAPIYEYMVSPKGTILEINKTACTILGYKKEELIGKHLTAIYAPESHEKMNFLLSKWKETGEIDNEEMIIETKQGEKRRVLLSTGSVRGDDGAILYSISILKDVTEINKIYDELNKNLWLQNVKLQKLNEIKKIFLKTTSHELRTPITSIKGYVQMLMKKTLGEINEEQRKSLDVILRNTNRLDSVIQNILDASTLESGIMKFSPRKVNPRALVEEITKTMEPFANKKGMTINVNLEKDLPDLMIDGERIKQVLMNLVDNAIKFSPNGSKIHIRVRKEKEDVLFEVQDFGQGIPKDKQGMIFDAFYQADSGDDRKFGGAGLSLALSRGFVGLHGGKIWFESTEGTGSTFLFTLPIQPIYNMENTDLNEEMPLEKIPEKSAGLAVNSATLNTKDEKVSDSITEYKKITATPKENEERYQALFNSSLELIYLHDLKGNFIDANPTALKLLGYSKEDLGSLNFSTLLDSGQIWKAMKVLNEIKKNGRQKEPTEYRLKTKNGTLIDVETTAEIVYRDGKPYAIRGIARNITEQKQAKQIVTESVERYRTLFENAPDFIIETDDKGNILAINPMMAKSMGAPSEKLIGKNIFDIFPREVAEERAKIARKALKEMKNQESEDERAGRYFQNIYVPIINPDGKKTIQLIARDVTSQKKAEEKIKIFSDAITSAFDCILLTDLKGNITYANESAINAFGYTSKEFLKLNITELDADPTVAKKVMQDMAVKGRWSGEVTNIRKNKEKFPAILSAFIIKDDNGNSIGTMGIIKDIAERKKIEKEIIESEEKLKQILDSSPDAIIVTDLNGNIIECNQTSSKLYGSPKAELIGKNALEFFSPKDRKKAKDNLMKTLEVGSIKNVEYTLLTKDGLEYPAELSTSLIRDASGNPQSFVSIVRDTTERKKAEEALKESQEKYRLIAENTNDLIIITNLDKTFRYVSPSVKSLGYTPDELIGQDSFILLHPEDNQSITSMLKQLVTGSYKPGTSSRFEYRLRDKSGVYHIYETAAKLVKDESGKHMILSTSRDITERKKTAEELQKSETLLNDVSEMAHVGGWEVDIKTKAVYWTKETYRIHDISFGEKFDLAKAVIFFDLPDRSKLEAALQRCMETGESFDLTLPFTSAKGRHLWTRALGHSLKDDSGKMVRLIGTFQDITERKKAEKEIKESEEKYRNVVEQAGDGIVIVQDLVIKYVNPRAFNIFGYNTAGMIGTLMTDYVHPDELLKLVEYYNRRMAGKDTPRSYELVLVHKDGREIDVELSGRAITYQEKPADMIMVHDITERKKAEKELKENINQLEQYKKVTVDRELKMIELKKEIDKLYEKLGEKTRYNVTEER